MHTNLTTRLAPFNYGLTFDPLPAIEETLFRNNPDMKLDISETDKNYPLSADFPSFKKENIKASMDGCKVSITADTQSDKTKTTGDMIWSERSHTRRKEISIPDNANVSSMLICCPERRECQDLRNPPQHKDPIQRASVFYMVGQGLY